MDMKAGYVYFGSCVLDQFIDYEMGNLYHTEIFIEYIHLSGKLR